MALFAAKAITSSGELLSSKHYLKIYIACISYANLCFLNHWAEIFGHNWDFMRRYALTWQSVAALVLDILLLGTLIWTVVCSILRTGSPVLVRILKWGIILALLLPVNVIRTDDAFVSLKQIQIPGTGLRAILVVAGVVLGIIVLIVWEKFSARVITAALTLTAPAMALGIWAASTKIAEGPPGGLYPSLPLQAALPQPADAPHVIWVIFDEWDSHLTFQQRPAGIELPEIDRFAQGALQATHVKPPAEVTVAAVPSLLTGRAFAAAKPKSPTELMLIPGPSETPVPFSSQETIFAAARHRGFNVGIVGWFLPYCRLIPECTVCSWHSGVGVAARAQYDAPGSVPALMAQNVIIQAQEVPLLYRLGINLDLPLHQRLHGRTYSRIYEDMVSTLTDRRLNLLFVHLSVPHGPMIYNAAQESITTGQGLNYSDNLRLTDRTVAALRRTLEQAGMWDSSTVLLTADHPLRVSYYRTRTRNTDNWPSFIPPGTTQHAEVPYLLKMAGQKQGITYNHEMQEVVTKQLLLSILSREVQTAEQVAIWLDAHQPQD